MVPLPFRGFGSGTTGGRGGRFVRVTSHGGPGSIRWALEQHPGEPLYIALCVEGETALGSTLPLRPDVTLDGRYAPGAGHWFTGERIEVNRGNVFLDGIVHLGNDPSPSGNSDCIRFGDHGGTHDVDGVYVRNCEFKHGRDEVFAITPRRNGEATGPRVLNMTVESTIIADATGASHEFLFFVGDGAERVTVTRNLLATGAGRFPLFKEYARLIEWVNNAAFNFNQNCVNAAGMAQVDFLGNLLRIGPLWTDIRGPIALDASNDFHEADTLVDGANSHGLYWTNTAARAARFAGSGLAVNPASSVAGMIAEHCGPRLHGGKRHALTQATIDEFLAGGAPAALATHPGQVRTVTGAAYPEANAVGVPLAYLDAFPGDTDPAAIIADGSAWDGLMVAERIGAWHVAPEPQSAPVSAVGIMVNAMRGISDVLDRAADELDALGG